jgi:ABC-type Fe3+-hydroxamate transport system substrate-binding protein
MVIDALGREVQLKGVPRTVVSLSPGITECLLGLSAGDMLRAVTDYCILPEALASIPRIGGSRSLDIAAIRALAPDLILAARDENDIAAVHALEAADLAVFITGMRTVEGTLTQLGILARLLDHVEQATALLDELQQAIDKAEMRRMTRRTVRTLMFTWADPWIAVGAETFTADLLRLCGAENTALYLPGRAPRADLGAFMRYNPELILLAGGQYTFTREHIAAFRRYGDVTAVLRRNVRICDGTLFARGGVHTSEAIRVLSALLA